MSMTPTPDRPPLPITEEESITMDHLRDVINATAARLNGGVLRESIEAVFERWGIAFHSRGVQTYWQTLGQGLGTLYDLGFTILEARQAIHDISLLLDSEEGFDVAEYIPRLEGTLARCRERHLPADIQHLYQTEERQAQARAALADAHTQGKLPVSAPTSDCAPASSEIAFVSSAESMLDWSYAAIDLLSTALCGLLTIGRGPGNGPASAEAVIAVANLSIDFVISAFHWRD